MQTVFAVHVFSGFGGGDGDQRVPVVGRGYLHGVDIVSGDEFPEIAVCIAVVVAVSLVDGAFRALGMRGVDVANGDDLGVGVPEERPHVAVALTTTADNAPRDSIAGGDLVGLAENRRGDDGRKGKPSDRSAGGAANELPSVETSFNGHPVVPCFVYRSFENLSTTLS